MRTNMLRVIKLRKQDENIYMIIYVSTMSANLLLFLLNSKT